MEGIAPTLHLCLILRQGIEMGQSMRLTLLDYQNQSDTFLNSMISNLLTRGAESLTQQQMTDHQRALFLIIEQGLRGLPVLQHLCSLEIEIKQACEDQIQEELLKLPFKVLIPLLFFQFPALVLLFLGPFLRQLTSNF